MLTFNFTGFEEITPQEKLKNRSAKEFMEYVDTAGVYIGYDKKNKAYLIKDIFDCYLVVDTINDVVWIV